MGQVPENSTTPRHYLLIGSGRLAKHLTHYFQWLDLPFSTWARREWATPQEAEERLLQKASVASHILLAIQDQALAEWVERPLCRHKIVVHFSGALSFSKAHGAHPLMTFSHELYPIETYTTIPFVCEKGHLSFHQLFPDVPNPSYLLAPQDKALYHALCVMSGNFTTILVEQVIRVLRERLHLPPEILRPYMERILANVLQHPETALTGPLARHDWAVIEKNLEALSVEPRLKALYQQFLHLKNLETPVAPRSVTL